MDAKPQRLARASHPPSTNENMLVYPMPAKHGVESKIATGVQAPARRVALGERNDLSNILKPTNLRQTKTIDNSQYEYSKVSVLDVLPATRPSTANASVLQPIDINARGSDKQAVIKQSKANKATVVFQDQPQQAHQPAAATIFNKSLSRKHKSQPSLKDRAPTLRRTQSKHFERIATQELIEDTLDAPYEDALEELPREGDNVQEHFPELSRHDTAQPAAVARPLPALPIEPAKDYVEGTTLLTPLEEYFDEDDGEGYYDDQAYTVATQRSLVETTNGAATLHIPTVTAQVQAELEHAAAWVREHTTLDDIADDLDDINMVAEYREEIFDYMHDLEARLLPDAHYMLIQTEMKWSMRAVLMEWVILVHGRLNLLPETLFLAVNYIDRFLSRKVVSLAKLQLVGATALFIAAKYEEVACPSIENIEFMCDGAYDKAEIFKAERFMLQMLQFDLGWPGPMSFLRLISKADDYDIEIRTMSKYLLEVTVMDERFVGLPASVLAAASHCLARLLLDKGDWTLAHVHYSQYTWTQLESLVLQLLDCVRDAKKHHLAVYEKYAHSRYRYASAQAEAAIAQGFRLDIEPISPPPTQQPQFIWPGSHSFDMPYMSEVQSYSGMSYCPPEGWLISGES